MVLNPWVVLDLILASRSIEKTQKIVMMAAVAAAAPVVNTGKHILEFFLLKFTAADPSEILNGLFRWFLYWLVCFDDFFSELVMLFEIANIYRFPVPVQQNALVAVMKDTTISQIFCIKYFWSYSFLIIKIMCILCKQSQRTWPILKYLSKRTSQCKIHLANPVPVSYGFVLRHTLG